MRRGVEYGNFWLRVFSSRLITMHLPIFRRFCNPHSSRTANAWAGLPPSPDLLFHRFAAPEISWRHARNAPERARKIILVLEAQVEAHVQHTEARVAQEFARANDAPVKNVSMRAETRASPEKSGEIVEAQFGVPRQFGESNILVEVRIDVSKDALQAHGRQTGILNGNLAPEPGRQCFGYVQAA